MIKLVILDMGHGGIDATGMYHCRVGGKQVRSNGAGTFLEGVSNRFIGNELARQLEECGEIYDRPSISVVHCSNQVEDIPLKDRSIRANTAYNAARKELGLKHEEILLVSVHSNAFKDPEVNGMEVYANLGNETTLWLADELVENQTVFRKRGWRDGSYLYMIRRPVANAVLLELGFFTSKRDRDVLRSEVAVYSLCNSLTKTIAHYGR